MDIELHPGQLEVERFTARFKVLACGRRWGKTVLGVVLCVLAALETDGICWWVTPRYKDANVAWRMLRYMASQIEGTTVRLADKLVELPGGGIIEIRTAKDPDGLRSEGLDFLVMDECAFIQERAWAGVLRPALIDRKGSALFISTPHGRNWFWKLYQIDDGVEWKSWHYSTGANPFIDPNELEAVKRQMTDRRYREEVLAEFLQGDESVFTNVIATEGIEPGWRHGREYVIGVDWGKYNDFTVATALDIESNEAVEVYRKNMRTTDMLTSQVANFCNKYKPRLIVAEVNGIGDPYTEQLENKVQGFPIERFTTNNTSKEKIIESLALAIDSHLLYLPNYMALLEELLAFSASRMRSGNIKLSAPEGFHDDCVMSLAFAWYAKNKVRRTGMEFGTIYLAGRRVGMR